MTLFRHLTEQRPPNSEDADIVLLRKFVFLDVDWLIPDRHHPHHCLSLSQKSLPNFIIQISILYHNFCFPKEVYYYYERREGICGSSL